MGAGGRSRAMGERGPSAGVLLLVKTPRILP